jgi:6-phosphogluconolactonase
MPSVSQSSPCHLAFSPEGGHLYCSHYGDGRVTVFRVEPSGSLWVPEQVIQHEGCGPTLPTRAPAVHYGRFTPDGNYICFCDLGLDVVRVYEPDADGLLSL